MSAPDRILLLGHRAHTRCEELQAFFESVGGALELEAAEGLDGVRQLRQWPPYDGAVLFLPMDDESSFASARQLIDQNRLLAFAVCHAKAARAAALLEGCERRDEVEHLAANDHGVPEFGALRESLQRLVARTRAARQAVLATDGEVFSLAGMLTRSDEFLTAVAMAQGVARVSGHVHITGETGAGKEKFAQLIHRESSRCHHRFEALNCAAIPELMAEGLLFGWKRGAFAGAVGEFPGHFVLANGGTLFLDEVAELTLAVQAKLLRVVQDGKVQALGACEPVAVDVRIVSATNESLDSLVLQKRFRDDLRKRLKVHVVPVPPLRRHSDDVPVLVEQIDAAVAREAGTPLLRLGVDALQVLCNHGWPGNVRELESTIRRLTVVPTRPITPREVLAAIHEQPLGPDLAAIKRRLRAGSGSAANGVATPHAAFAAAPPAPRRARAPRPAPASSAVPRPPSPPPPLEQLHAARQAAADVMTATDLAREFSDQYYGGDLRAGEELMQQLMDHVAEDADLVRHYRALAADDPLRLRDHVRRLDDKQVVRELRLYSDETNRSFRRAYNRRRQGGAEA